MSIKRIVFIFIRLLVFIPIFSVCALLALPVGAAKDFAFSPAGDSASDTHWADSVFSHLSPDERLAQLFIVECSSKWTPENKLFKDVERFVTDYGVGGVIFFYGGPVRQAVITNRFQAQTRVPLMIAQDGEWGLGMRLDSTISFPRQLTMGALRDDAVIYETGLEIGRQCNRLGVNIDFAPCVDVYNNPDNSVIVNRSFGSDVNAVARKACALMTGMQDCNILTTAKHFPGHGNTAVDSHKSLPEISSTAQELDSVEMFPYKYLIKNGLRGIMTGHLFVPSLDTSSLTPASLSKDINTGIIKNKLGFKGLIFTDALAMKAVAGNYKPGQTELNAFLAGVDVFLMPADFEKAFQTLKEARDSGLISQKDIDARCIRVLRAKKQMGLNRFKPVDTLNLYNDLNYVNSNYLINKIARGAVTLIKNDNDILPLKSLDTKKIAVVAVGNGETGAFEEMTGKYTATDIFAIKKSATPEEFSLLISKLKPYDVVILAMHGGNQYPSTFGFTSDCINFAQNIARKKSVILDIFNNPLSFNRFTEKDNFKAVIISYENSEPLQIASAQMIFGGQPFLGRLPLNIDSDYKCGKGLETIPVRLQYVEPQDVGADEFYLGLLDSLLIESIRAKAFPGCQIVAAVDGKVFYEKSFGYFTYDNTRKVTDNDIYDLASVTKITSVVPSLMHLYEQNRFNPDEKLNAYLPEARGTNKADLLCKDILLHQAGLQPWLSVQRKAFRRGSYVNDFVSDSMTDFYCNPIGGGYFVCDAYRDTVMKLIYNSKLIPKKKYLYSDLGFYLLARSIENITHSRLDSYTDSLFHKLGAYKTCYCPHHLMLDSICAPTEFDKLYHRNQLQGYVQDMGAALMGGISGHSGLFSNADDLAKYMQMLLNGGVYGGEKFFDKKTVDLFTGRYKNEKNRRGLGFDKNTDTGAGSASSLSSAKGFGHTGYSGTFVWADPDTKIVFIFLSNRIYPDAENNKILELNVRKRAQSLIYKSLEYGSYKNVSAK